jgi:hypothetical protein
MNFRKHICILLTFFLLGSNLGLAFNVHYCDDKIASVSLSTASNIQEVEMNCCGEVEIASKCCKNKIIKTEIKSDQILVKSLCFDANFIPVFNEWKPFLFSSNFNFKSRDNVTYYCDANAPPLYLLYSQYTFYA